MGILFTFANVLGLHSAADLIKDNKFFKTQSDIKLDNDIENTKRFIINF
jgi:hypothetical protein